MKLTTALKSRTVWCGIIVTAIAAIKLILGDSIGDVPLDEVEKNKELLASNFVLVVQGLLGVGAIIFRIKAKNRD